MSVCVATPRRAKLDIGVRSSKDGKSGVLGGGTSGKMLKLIT